MATRNFFEQSSGYMKKFWTYTTTNMINMMKIELERSNIFIIFI